MLFPFLFIIRAESLSSLIHAKESFDCLNGCKIVRGAPPISLFFFFLMITFFISELQKLKHVLLSHDLKIGSVRSDRRSVPKSVRFTIKIVFMIESALNRPNRRSDQ